jgi:hypothetical protein
MWECNECKTQNDDTGNICKKCGHQTITFSTSSEKNKSQENKGISSQTTVAEPSDTKVPLIKYSYKARSEDGKPVKGEMEASSEIDLSKRLGEKGFYLTGIIKISQQPLNKDNEPIPINNKQGSVWKKVIWIIAFLFSVAFMVVAFRFMDNPPFSEENFVKGYFCVLISGAIAVLCGVNIFSNLLQEKVKDKNSHFFVEGNIEVVAGDIEHGLWQVGKSWRGSGWFVGKDAIFAMRHLGKLIYFKKDKDIERIERLTEEKVKKVGGTLAWGVAGAALLGPLGAIGGILIGGNKKEVVFSCYLKDGRKFMAHADGATWIKITEANF